MSFLFQNVREGIWDKWRKWLKEEKSCNLLPSYQLLCEAQMASYIKACIRMTWRMVTQIPPLKLEYSSSYLQSFHKKMGYHTSPDMRASVKSTSGQAQEEIACYLWPGLFDGRGRMIRAGEVLCKIKEAH